MSNLDENSEYVLLLEDPSGLAIPAKVSTNGELVIEYITDGVNGGTFNPSADGNHTYVGLSERADGTLSPLLVRSTGELDIDTTNLTITA